MCRWVSTHEWFNTRRNNHTIRYRIRQLMTNANEAIRHVTMLMIIACYGLHQIQDIGVRIPGNQGISPRLHPTAHQTLHTDQTSTLRYLWHPPPVTPALLVHDCSLFWPHDGGMTFLWTSEQPIRCPRSNADWKRISSDCFSPSLPHK